MNIASLLQVLDPKTNLTITVRNEDKSIGFFEGVCAELLNKKENIFNKAYIDQMYIGYWFKTLHDAGLRISASIR